MGSATNVSKSLAAVLSLPELDTQEACKNIVVASGGR